MKITLEDNVPVPDDYKFRARSGRTNWVKVLQEMKDGQSFFAPDIKRSTLITAFSEFRKTLPEEDFKRYDYVAIENKEGEIGTRFWLHIAPKKEEPATGGEKDKSVKEIVQEMRHPPKP